MEYHRPTSSRAPRLPSVRRRRIALAFALAALLGALFALPTPAMAQREAGPPDGWRWVLDGSAKLAVGTMNRGTDSTFDFSQMAPGWHITMGPGAVLFPADARATGRFVVEGEMILFPGGTDNEYGIFVGGEGLDGDAAVARWTAFVVRGDGQAAVLERRDGAVHVLSAWTAQEKVVKRARGATAKNFVTVRAELDSVRFHVNGERIGAWPRSALRVDGAFGIRIGQGVNIHITNLDLTRRLAPVPER
ncbi:MAG: hypothetical protein JNL44_04015 [Gemmatimonadetes bacterium]|nr:hypothetical protein [Gemmatimonadota bacterium]